jgi:hypothetical protein
MGAGYRIRSRRGQLQGCYIDRDGPRSLHRVRKRRLATR